MENLPSDYYSPNPRIFPNLIWLLFNAIPAHLILYPFQNLSASFFFFFFSSFYILTHY